MAVLYANTQKDMDSVMKPATVGFEADTLLRSVESPQQLFFRVGMPVGASLLQATDGSGGVWVMDEGVVIASVSPPSARDAFGTSVPVSMSVSGSTLILTVDHRSGESQKQPQHAKPQHKQKHYAEPQKPPKPQEKQQKPNSPAPKDHSAAQKAGPANTQKKQAKKPKDAAEAVVELVVDSRVMRIQGYRPAHNVKVVLIRRNIKKNIRSYAMKLNRTRGNRRKPCASLRLQM